MKIYTLGTSHGATEPGKSCSGNLITVNGANYLFDCGGNVEGRMTDMGLSIKDIRAVFITHMHEDHAGTLSAIVKRFTVYIRENLKVHIFLPEQNGINAFKNWVSALHLLPSPDKVEFGLVTAGTVYSDENITVNAIATKHIENGKYPSYAYEIITADKRMLYTGDLSGDFQDYPQVLLKEKFDAVLCELVHFSVEKNLPMILDTKTKKLIFTHMGLHNVVKIERVIDDFPFDVSIANDGDCFEV